jgi:hypothetical protein
MTRWYDHDPQLLEVLEILRAFPDEVREQAEKFIAKIEGVVGPETLESLKTHLPEHPKNRWYDQDPTVRMAIELLRVIPPEAQRQVAQQFLEAMRRRGLSANLLRPDVPSA